MTNEKKLLRERVEYIINKFGYKTSYAENMLYAISQVDLYDPLQSYSIANNIAVILQQKNIVVKLDVSNQFIQFHETEWNLYELLGEYILNQNPNYFNER